MSLSSSSSNCASLSESVSTGAYFYKLFSVLTTVLTFFYTCLTIHVSSSALGFIQASRPSSLLACYSVSHLAPRPFSRSLHSNIHDVHHRAATIDTSVHTGGEKIMALIFPFVARLTKVQVKTICDTVTSIETNALVETLIKIEGWWRSTQSITRLQERRSRL